MRILRIARESERNLLNKYFLEEPEYTLFFNADIRQYGMNCDVQTVWVGFINQKIVGVFLRYYESFCFYSRYNDFPKEWLYSLIIQYKAGILNMSGNTYQAYQDILQSYKVNPCTMAHLIQPIEVRGKAIATTYKDARDIMEAQFKIEEFAYLRKDNDIDYQVEKLERNYKGGFYLGYIVKEEDKVIANANTSCIGDFAAMIGGVFCLKEYRRQGYAKACVSALCKELQKRNLVPTLFYENPAAAKLYHQLGFEDCGQWYLLTR